MKAEAACSCYFVFILPPLVMRYAQQSDEELWPLMLAGEAQAFAAIYERRQAGIYRFALRMSGSETVAEDITQDVFLSLMRESHEFDRQRGTVKGYLYGVARNRVLRHFARKKEFVPLVDETTDEMPVAAPLIASDNPLLELTRRETVKAVQQAILTLPPHYREVVVLCYLQEMSYEDAATVIGCPVGTVRSRLHRARASLWERLHETAAPDTASQNAPTAMRFAL